MPRVPSTYRNERGVSLIVAILVLVKIGVDLKMHVREHRAEDGDPG